ncbi:protein artemis [Podospora australis]|uniref:Protein artemis n=1 Tax=Podospora australis TaxID=1536484 RepID=A0AAN6WTN8_9PEZI|nr:protein artemis [Podospora australis]
MSTFNGIVHEFPDIRVDFFRSHQDRRPPLACFLSHIHSDHLAGLESLRSPFIYCSAATREILLRLERFPCRINYAKGILEARVQRYRHLKNLLKPLPLETPTVLELGPGNFLQVTLFNANHCPGAVMFLFESEGRSALYTGDIRSEPWFVNAVARSPALIEYSTGLKTLDTIYLDTSFINDIKFPTKSDGIRELLQKVSMYPPDTIFHFQAWTYGYEDVWIALSKALKSKIHVDQYKMVIYRSLVAKDSNNRYGAQFHLAPEAPGLVGFMCGNTYHEGCLIDDDTVRLHSCEKGNYCKTVQESSVVWIRPIITRTNGQDVAELGVGGGGEDLEQEVELDYLLPQDVEFVLNLVNGAENVSEDLKEEIRAFLLSTVASGRKVPLDIERSIFGEDNETDLMGVLTTIAEKLKPQEKQVSADNHGDKALPNIITFPYSRHSSFPELCDLVAAFRPRDVWPCTVDVPQWLKEGITVEDLFGQYCSSNLFLHDKFLSEKYPNPDNDMQDINDTQATTDSAGTSQLLADNHSLLSAENHLAGSVQDELPVNSPFEEAASMNDLESDEEVDMGCLQNSQESSISDSALKARRIAFQTILDNARFNSGGQLGLLSTTDNHSRLDKELDFGAS